MNKITSFEKAQLAGYVFCVVYVLFTFLLIAFGVDSDQFAPLANQLYEVSLGIFVFVATGLWVLALRRVSRSDRHLVSKIIWYITILFTPIFGALVFFLWDIYVKNRPRGLDW